MTDESIKVAEGIDERLKEAVRRLVEAYQPEAIWLFGSHARGDAGPDSDYDLMVIVPDDADRERRQSFAGYRALKGIGFPKDVLVATHTGFHKRLHIAATLPATILREGRRLYVADNWLSRRNSISY